MNAKRTMILRYCEEVVIDHKAFVRFKKGLERSTVISYRYRYYIALTYVKTRYPKLEIEEYSFILEYSNSYLCLI